MRYLSCPAVCRLPQTRLLSFGRSVGRELVNADVDGRDLACDNYMEEPEPEPDPKPSDDASLAPALMARRQKRLSQRGSAAEGAG